MDTEIFKEIGLSNSEIKVYISLLELGSSSAGAILVKSNLQNSVLHRALNSLIEKGLIGYVLEGKKKIYNAINPENFHEFIGDKIKKFDDILPELKKKQSAIKTKNFAEIFKGKKGINNLYITLLNSKGNEYNTFGGGSDVTYNIMGETWWKNLHAKRISKKINCRQVFDESIRKFGNELNKKSYTKIKFLPKEYSQFQETIIIGNFVGIAIFTENPYGVLIRDKLVADGYRKQFEILWDKAKN